MPCPVQDCLYFLCNDKMWDGLSLRSRHEKARNNPWWRVTNPGNTSLLLRVYMTLNGCDGCRRERLILCKLYSKCFFLIHVELHYCIRNVTWYRVSVWKAMLCLVVLVLKSYPWSALENPAWSVRLPGVKLLDHLNQVVSAGRNKGFWIHHY